LSKGHSAADAADDDEANEEEEASAWSGVPTRGAAPAPAASPPGPCPLSFATFFIMENMSPFTAHAGLSQSAPEAALPLPAASPAIAVRGE
jgi:hypothetical protein